jgi:hypothetical protein
MKIPFRSTRRILLSLAILLLAALASGQQPAPDASVKPEPRVLRIGIPPMDNTSSRSVSRQLQRDWLVRAFQPDKKKKAKRPETQRFEAVPLESDSRGDALGEARDKHCDYVLFTTLVELREPGDREQRTQPGTVKVGRDPLSVYPDQTVMHDPVHFAVVDYRLQRVGDMDAQMASSVSGQEHNDENGTVQSLLFMIVNRVKDELRGPESAGPQ